MRRLLRVVTLIRYRFFLYAGLLPYLLGAAWAYASAGVDAAMFWSGFGGVVLAVIGVEAFNEYFDARMGTDRVFNPADLPPISDAVFWCGVLAFAGALAVGALHIRIESAGRSSPSRCSAEWPGSSTRRRRSAGRTGVWASSSSGSRTARGWCSAASISTPVPFRGRHSRRRWCPGLSIMSLAVVNAIPDYHQDVLVGKRNLVVRLGRAKGVVLYLALAGAALAVVAAGILTGIFPADCAVALLALCRSSRAGDARARPSRRRAAFSLRCGTWSRTTRW